MYTTTLITSHCKGTEYAPKGAKVTVIHITGHVAIVEYNGERFPCLAGMLSEVEPGSEETVKEVKIKKQGQPKSEALKVKSQNQISLL